MTPWQRDFALVVLPSLAALCVCFLIDLLNDGDTNWHLAAGAWMIEHRQVLHTDPFSHTFAGKPWVTHEWLSEIIMAQAYAWAGWNGLLLVTGACLAAVVGMIAWEIRRRLGALSVLVVLICVFALLSPSVLARPHMLALPVLAFWTIQLLRARSRGAFPSLWLAPLMLIWANLHGSYVIGLVIAAVLALEALVEAPKEGRIEVSVRWGAFGVLAGLMCLVTPHGLQGILYPFQILGMTSLPDIAEWQSIDFSELGGFELVLLVTLYVGFSKGLVIPPVRLLFLLLLLHMALQHQRQAMVLAIVAPLFLVEPLARALRRDAPVAEPAAWRQRAGLMAATAALVIAIAAVRLATPVARAEAMHAPIAALSRTPAQFKAQPVFNDYSFGGWLILNGIPSFVDGRADMFGDAFVRDYFAAERGDMAVFERLRQQYGVGWTILKPNTGLVAELDSSALWRRVHADDTAVVHVYAPRSPGPAAPAAAPGPGG